MLQLIFIVVVAFLVGSIVTLRILPHLTPMRLQDGKVLVGTQAQVLQMLGADRGEGVCGDVSFTFIVEDRPIAVTSLSALAMSRVLDSLEPQIVDGLRTLRQGGDESPSLKLHELRPSIVPGRYRVQFFYNLHWQQE